MQTGPKYLNWIFLPPLARHLCSLYSLWGFILRLKNTLCCENSYSHHIKNFTYTFVPMYKHTKKQNKKKSAHRIAQKTKLIALLTDNTKMTFLCFFPLWNSLCWWKCHEIGFLMTVLYFNKICNNNFGRSSFVYLETL